MKVNILYTQSYMCAVGYLSDEGTVAEDGEHIVRCCMQRAYLTLKEAK